MPTDAVRAVADAIAATPTLEPWLAGRPPGTLWVGFSGGRDSTVLLHALRGAVGVTATHIDHGLHPDSVAWARHCERTARELGAAFDVRRVRVPETGNREHAARRARYEVWRDLLRPGDVLALAHHADDQAETRLWQLFTGREPGGMPVERRVGDGRLVRPLLRIGRAAIGAYAEHFGLDWIEDPSNADLDLDRNYIRADIVPRIEARFPDAMQRLARPRPPAMTPRPLPTAGAGEQAVADWLRMAGLPVALSAVAEVVRQTAAARDRAPRVRVAPGVQAWRHADRWHLLRDRAPLVVQDATVGCEVQTTAGTLGWRQDARGLPPGLAVRIRPRAGGERIRADRRNVTKSVKALLREAAIPPWHRADWPLLYAGGQLAAVPGLAVSAAAAVANGHQPRWTPSPDF